MEKLVFDRHKNPLLLIARLLLMLLFLIFGWEKASNFSGTVAFMASIDVPVPAAATIVAIIMELGAGIAIALGVFTRPVAFLLAVFTLCAALLGHPFWSMLGDDRVAHSIFFYKNLSIMGGLFLLCITGPGKFSIDRK